jgi:hypoxanthine-DNA glycosylase
MPVSNISNPSSLLAGFAPVIDARTRILILGSFPGRASLDAAQYYAHPRNQFWRLISDLIGADLVSLPYAQKLARLRAHQLGLWDVIAACARQGSLDSAIRQAQQNDFTHLKKRCPALHRIAFNGKASGRHAPLFAAAGFDTVILPSSSPAYAAMTFDDKLKHWRGIMR